MYVGEMLWLLGKNMGDSFNSMARMLREWEGNGHSKEISTRHLRQGLPTSRLPMATRGAQL